MTGGLRWVALVSLGIVSVASAAHAQADRGALGEFLAAARAGSQRYRDQPAATADGYRPVGPDFPSMGQHWIQPALLVSGRLDPARPPILEYATIAGRPTLVGVAYATLAADGRAPSGLPVPAAAWHFHGGTVDDESFVLSHAGLAAHEPPGPSLAVLHAWVWLENPRGVLETDNWALPFARLGLPAPGDPSPAAARVLALAAGGPAYFDALVRAVARPDSAAAARISASFEEAGAAVRARLAAREPGAALDSAALDQLRGVWEELWVRVRAAVTPVAAERLTVVTSAVR